MKVKNFIAFALLLTPLVIGAQSFRPITGHNNNMQNPTWGAAGGEVVNRFEPAFEDGFSSPTRSSQMNPREISNTLFEQTIKIKELVKKSGFIIHIYRTISFE